MYQANSIFNVKDYDQIEKIIYEVLCTCNDNSIVHPIFKIIKHLPQLHLKNPSGNVQSVRNSFNYILDFIPIGLQAIVINKSGGRAHLQIAIAY